MVRGVDRNRKCVNRTGSEGGDKGIVVVVVVMVMTLVMTVCGW